MANPHINYATFKSRFGDLGITEWTKYNYLSNYNFGLPAQTEVPSDYLELEYIRSDGGQYINTGVDGSNGGTVDTMFMFKDLVNGFICGAHSSTPPYKQSFLIHESAQSGNTLLSGECGDTAVTINCATDKLYHFVLKGIPGEYLQSEINGESLTSPIQVGEIANSNILLLNADNGGTVRIGAKANVYKWSFYDKYGKLIRDFHPARRLSDGAIGMYDTVTKSFFGNNGSGSFTAGPMKQRYIRVEYVQFNGNDTIDTGLTTKHATYVQDADIQFTQFNNGEQQYLGADYGVYWGINDSSHFTQAYNRDLSPNKAADTNQHHFVSRINTQESESELYIDGVKYSAKRPTTYQVGYSIYVGYAFPTVPVYAKVYSYKIYEDGVLLRNFVPVYDLVTEKYGLFDLVSGTFYGSVNNKLTGPFSIIRHFVFQQSNASNISWYGDFQGKGTFYIDRGQSTAITWTYTWGYDLQNAWYYNEDSLLFTYREQNANHAEGTHNMNRGYVFVPPTTEDEARAYLYAHPIEFWLFAV